MSARAVTGVTAAAALTGWRFEPPHQGRRVVAAGRFRSGTVNAGHVMARGPGLVDPQRGAAELGLPVPVRGRRPSSSCSSSIPPLLSSVLTRGSPRSVSWPSSEVEITHTGLHLLERLCWRLDSSPRLTGVVAGEDGRLEELVDIFVQQLVHHPRQSVRVVLVGDEESESQVSSLSPGSLAQQRMVGLANIRLQSYGGAGSLETQLFI